MMPSAHSEEDKGFQVDLSLLVGVQRLNELTEDDFSADLSAGGSTVRCPVSIVSYSAIYGLSWQPYKDTPIVASASFHCGVAVTGPANMTVAVKTASHTFLINMPPAS